MAESWPAIQPKGEITTSSATYTIALMRARSFDSSESASSDSVIGLTNVISFKIMQGSITTADWEHYLGQLRRVPMTAENAKAIWVVLNRVRDGMPVDGDRVFEAIQIINQRRPFGTIESAAIGYFITGNTRQPEKAYPYFAHAIQAAKDPTFGPGIIEELRKDSHSEMADRLEAVNTGQDEPASP